LFFISRRPDYRPGKKLMILAHWSKNDPYSQYDSPLTKFIGEAHVRAARLHHSFFVPVTLTFPLASVPAFFYNRRQGKSSDHHTFETP
jgi:hypothetical protein